MLDVALLPKQWEVFNPCEGVDYDITLYQGGVGSGKTFLGGLKGLCILANNPGATWLVGADAWERLKITTWETWRELLDGANILHRVNKSDHIITIPEWGDARAIFKGVDDPQALRSVNGIGGHLEEASLITESAYLEFLGRLRQAKAGDAIHVILTTNPQAQKDWLYDHFVEQAGITTETIRGNEIKVSRRRVIARTLDNPHVSDAFIASLKASYDEELWKIMVLGQDGDFTRGLVSYNFSELNITDTEYQPSQTIYLSCDFNVDPMSWVCAHKYNGEYHFFDEIVIENTNIIECVDEFIKRYPNHNQLLVLGGDASGDARNVQNQRIGGTSYTQMMDRFQEKGHPSRRRIDIRKANPLVPDRIAAWNAMMCNTDGVRRIFINERCKHLIKNLQILKYNEHGELKEATLNEIRKDPKRKFEKHIFDAASYLVEKHDPVIFRNAEKRKDPIVHERH